MIAVLGGSAEIVGWPRKVVLCAAEVRRQSYLTVRYVGNRKGTEGAAEVSTESEFALKMFLILDLVFLILYFKFRFRF